MKKVLLLCLFSFIGMQSYVFACVDLQNNVSRYQENNNVLSLQNFLYEKGYLKATPNGYFGVGTFAAVRAYQKANGITQTGTAGPLTRSLIKKESCGNKSVSTSSFATTSSATQSVAKKDVSSVKKETEAPQVPAVKKVLSKNEQRFIDAEILLTNLYRRFSDSRGVWPTTTISTSTAVELCVSPRITKMNQATATEVLVLTTPESPCKDYIDISYLSDAYLSSIPRDPILATSSPLIGYVLMRGISDDITIMPKTTDNKEIIKVRCNFVAGCKTIQRITGEEYGTPFITSLSRTVMIRDSLPKEGITVYGKDFAATNTVYLTSRLNQKVYEIGTFTSSNKTSFVISASTTSVEIPCGISCREKLPLGDYALHIKTQGGESNTAYVRVVGFTTSSILTRADTTVIASSSQVKIGTISVSTSLPGTLKSLTLKATTTSAKLPGKLTNFKVKDLVSNQTITASGLTFNLGNASLPENNSRFYDLYVDVGNVLVDEAGFITYGGHFTLYDTLGKVDIDLPIKEISFTAAPF